MTEYKLIQFNNTQKDLFFWIKLYLIEKLATLDKSKIKVDFDIPIYFHKIRNAKNIDDIKKIASEIKKQLRAFYNISLGVIRFYNFIETQQLEKITDISNSIFINDFIGKELDEVGKGTIITIKSHVKQLFDFIELYNNYYGEGKPYLFNISKDIDGKRTPVSKLWKKVPIWLNQEEFKKLDAELVKCKDFVKAHYDFQRAKDVLIMKILLYSGITVSELVNLHLKDIKEVKNNSKDYIQLNIYNSSNVDRKIPIVRKKIIRYLDSYLSLREHVKHDYLFYDKADNEIQLKNQYVLNTVKKFFRFSKIKKTKITAEVLRNTFGIMLHNLGSPEIYTQNLLGHKNLKTTKALVKHADIEFIKSSDVFNMADKL